VNRRQFILTTAAGVALPTLGHSYILPSHYVVKQAQAALDARRGLQVGLLGRMWTSKRPAVVEIGERWLFGPKTRLDVSGPEGQAAHWTSQEAPTGHTALLPPPAVHFAISGLFGTGNLSQHLAGLGILASPQALHLFNGEIAISMGADPAQLTLPQAWFHQETFLPLRLIFRSDRSTYDLHMTDWDTPITQGKFPRKIQIRRDGRPLRQLTVSTMQQPQAKR